MLCDNQARYVGNAAVLQAPQGAMVLGVFFPKTVLRYCLRLQNRSGLLSTAAKSEREEWNTCGGTCTYAFRYLMGCFNAVSASTLAQNEAEKIYKKSKNVLHYCVGCIILFI